MFRREKTKQADHPPLSWSRRWLRRLIRFVVFLIVFIVLLRGVLWFGMPWFLERTFAAFDLDASYQSLHLSLLTGDLELWHLKICPKGDEKVLTDLEYCKADVSLTTLLQGRLVVPRLEFDGLVVTIERQKDGTLVGWQSLVRLATSGSKQQSPPRQAQRPKELADPFKVKLQSPLRLDALRLQHVRINYKDASVEPAVDTHLDFNMRLSDLGSLWRPTRFQLIVTVDGILDQLLLEGTADGDADSLEGHFEAALQGAYPGPVEAYLRQIGVALWAKQLDAGFHGSFAVQLSETTDPNSQKSLQQLAIEAGLQDIRVLADHASEVSLGACGLQAEISAANGIHVESLDVSDGRLRFWRDPEGGISVAGVYLKKPSRLRGPKRPKKSSPKSPPPSSAPSTEEVTNEGLTWSVGKVDLKAVELIWEEQRVAEVPPLHLHVDEGSIGPIQAPIGGVRRTPMQGHWRLPGIINEATIEGHCDLISRNKYVELACDFHDVTPKNLGGYLNIARLTSEHESAHLSGRARWSLTRGVPGTPSRNSAEIYDVKLVDQGKTLAALEHLIVKDIAKDKVKRRLSIDRIEVQGDQTTFRMDAQGKPHLWGFGIGTAKPKPIQPAVPTKTEDIEQDVIEAPQVAVAPKQRLEFLLKALDWDVGEITLIDETEPNQEPAVRTASLQGAIENFVLNAHNAEELDDGRVEIQLTIPELIEELKVQGVVSSDASDTVFDLTVDGQGLEFQEMAPYLQPFGLKPHMDTSSLHLDLDARLSPTPTTTLLSLNLADCRLADAKHRYISLGGLTIDEFNLSMGRLIQLKGVDVNEPRLFLMRDPNGLPIFAGMSLLPKPPKVESESTTPKRRKATPGIDIARFSVRGAELSFLDQRLDPPVQAKLGFELDVKDINSINWKTPAIVAAQWQLPGVMEKASFDAKVQHDPNRTEIKSQFQVDGLHPRLLARYLPEGSTPLVRRGKLRFEADASIDRDPNGAKTLNAQVRGFDFRDVDESAAWVHLDEVQLNMETLQQATRQIIIHDMHVSGIEARTEKGQDGRFHVMGFAIGADPNKGIETELSPAVDLAQDVNTLTTQETVVVNAGPRAIPKPLPDLIIHNMHLDVRRLAFQDFNNPAEPTVALEEFVLANTETIHMLGDKAGTHPPARITMKGRVHPWIDTVDVNMAVAPFATPGSLAVDVNVAGIQGTPIMTWLPQLADRIDATDVTDGRIRGQFRVTATIARRRATEFDFRQPFGATLSAKRIRFNHGDDETWNGLDEMHMEVSQIDLQHQRYHIRSLEMVQPQCRLIQEPNGLRFSRMLLKTPTDAEEDPNHIVVVAAESTPKATAMEKPDLQVRLDQLLISGLDFYFEDLTVAPHTILPLNGLDLDLRGFVYPVPAKASPIRFNTIMTAGRVPIRSIDGKISKRFLLQEISASGNVTPGKEPQGWVKAGIRGFEMRALRGVADKQGIQIRDGIMDVGVDMRIRPTRRANTTIRIAMSDLSMRDSSDGVIQKVLLLPVSLDVAIYMLQGLDGTLRVNVPVTIDLEDASVDNLSSAVVGATAAVLGKAIAKSPVKLATGATQLLTNTGRLLTGASETKEERKPVEYEPIEMIFEPGQVTLNNALQIQIDELAKQLKKNKHLRVTARHQFGMGDLMIAERLVNPKAEDNVELLSQLRHLQKQMTNERTDLAAKTQAAFGAGDFIDGGRLSSQLADLDGKLGLLEAAIDNILEQSGPGSEHLARRRTRQGALSLARSRLISVRDALYETKVKDIKTKLQITQPSFIIPKDNQPGRVILTLSSVR